MDQDATIGRAAAPLRVEADEPGVGESAVIGVPHPDLGEAAVAIVTRSDPALDEAALLAGLSHLARFKQPRRILFAESLPRNAMGKVQKAALRAAHAALFNPAAPTDT